MQHTCVLVCDENIIINSIKVIKFYLFQDITHENISVLLYLKSTFIIAHEQSYSVVYVFKYIKRFITVIAINCEPDITDIGSNHGAQHNIDIIKVVSVEQYLIYGAERVKFISFVFLICCLVIHKVSAQRYLLNRYYTHEYNVGKGVIGYG